MQVWAPMSLWIKKNEILNAHLKNFILLLRC